MWLNHLAYGWYITFTLSVLCLLRNTLAFSTPRAENDLLNRVEEQQFEEQEYHIQVRDNGFNQWKKALKKGKELDCAMKATKDLAAACFSETTSIKSTFTKFSDFEKWGWQAEERPLRISNLYETNLASIILDGLGVKDDDLIYIEIAHDETVIVDGVTYALTGAHYDNMYDVHDGLIIVNDIQSPGAVNRECPVDHLTKLQRWSDVSFLQWQELCRSRQHSVKKLNHVVQTLVTNPITESVLCKALGETENTNWEKYKDGLILDSKGDAFTAVLGTPNGSGTAWMLIQHKDQLGLKKVSQITVYGIKVLELKWVPALVFKIGDV
ncbi:hypothetical protein N7495_004064 [Penicillium taxi]|uniref:uncharacterized protein n=1 Tax=Penicillium taxi TaxID=168475 RepID=UPI002545876A|nr:uncharacterized protein N7495_004064 [Penicillium taxi]KAJ5899320.1 hypothetical protein N7495_004064 [Penicillium taxi]